MTDYFKIVSDVVLVSFTFFEKVKLDILCESSVMHTMNMLCQELFSRKKTK